MDPNINCLRVSSSYRCTYDREGRRVNFRKKGRKIIKIMTPASKVETLLLVKNDENKTTDAIIHGAVQRLFLYLIYQEYINWNYNMQSRRSSLIGKQLIEKWLLVRQKKNESPVDARKETNFDVSLLNQCQFGVHFDCFFYMFFLFVCCKW